MRRTVTILLLTGLALTPMGVAHGELGEHTERVARKHACADDGAFHTGLVGVNCEDLDAHVAGITGLAGAVADEMVCSEAGVAGTGVVGVNCDDMWGHVNGMTGLVDAVAHEMACTEAGANLKCDHVHRDVEHAERDAAKDADKAVRDLTK